MTLKAFAIGVFVATTLGLTIAIMFLVVGHRTEVYSVAVAPTPAPPALQQAIHPEPPAAETASVPTVSRSTEITQAVIEVAPAAAPPLDAGAPVAVAPAPTPAPAPAPTPSAPAPTAAAPATTSAMPATASSAMPDAGARVEWSQGGWRSTGDAGPVEWSKDWKTDWNLGPAYFVPVPIYVTPR